MKFNINYINNFPNFLTLQRISFCWFITQGLNQELTLFSQIYNFNQDIEYIIFGNEYTLTKPPYNISIARKYNGNYKTQIIIPIEIRNKKKNNVKYYNQFPLINLPLMTTHATFVLNGCERVIISQLIRSPGIYFEKNKIQHIPNHFKQNLINDKYQLFSMLPPGEAFLPEYNLFFPIKTLISNPLKIKIISYWKNNYINYFSIKYFKQIIKKPSFYFIQSFKLYKIIIHRTNYYSKIKLIKFFIKWLKLKIKLSNYTKKQKINKIFYLLIYFNFLIKLLFKYKLLIFSKVINIIIFSNLNIHFLLKTQFLKLIYIYNNTIINSQKFLHIQLNSKLLFITQISQNWLYGIQNLKLLKKNLQKIILKTNTIKILFKFQNLQPTFSFSKNFKKSSKYLFNKNELIYKFKKYKYLKIKNQLNFSKKDIINQTNFPIKYTKKYLYTGLLIPEYGSWIRFRFQKNIENDHDTIIIQLDKSNQKPILYFLKEMGLTNLEIYQNLQHSEFFYFKKPVLINLNYLIQISKFSQIFDPFYYRLGKIGRIKINHQLNLKINERIQIITYDDIFAIIDKLLNLALSGTTDYDIDHFKNRRIRAIGEILQNLIRISLQRLVRQTLNEINSNSFLNLKIINATIKEFFGSSQLSQYLDQTNPLSSLTHRRRISGLTNINSDQNKVSFNIRDIHPSQYGRICPIETPEGQNVGLISSLTTSTRINKFGFLETPFWRVINGKVIKTKYPIYLTAEIEELYKIASTDLKINKNNYLIENIIPVRYKQEIINVKPIQVDFITVSPIQIVSIAASLIPFFEHDDANRALMGSNMQRQSVPLLLPQKPIVGTGLENQIAINSGMILISKITGIVDFVSSTKIILKNKANKKIKYKLQKYLRSNQETSINQRPIVWKGEKVKLGQILTDGPSIKDGELALGQNILICYMPWHGYNFEDAILINERLIYDDVFTSIHIERYKININIDQNPENFERITKNIPNLKISETKHLTNDGFIKIGIFVNSGDILVGKVNSNLDAEQIPEARLLKAIFGIKSKSVKDNSYRLPNGENGRVIEILTFNRKIELTYQIEKIYIFLAKIHKIQVGDKIAGRHGNKGIISRILPRQDMPFLPDGTPIDIILNPLGVPSRMNVGQLYECLLGLAGNKLNYRFKILPFDEMYGLEMSRILINKKLRQASIKKNESWLFNPYSPGKIILCDGRTGIEFDNPITVGNAYMLKLIHLVSNKMHARSIGPYSLITQQPLRGKAQQGGQRFGEMEVWALEGFGAAFTLQELLTIKSDDIEGRNETLKAIIKGNEIPPFGIPESFKVLLQELRSIGLDISTYKIKEFNSLEKYETEIDLFEESKSLIKSFSTNLNLNNISF